MALSEEIIADESTIRDYIPQKSPMVMIGKLLEADGSLTRTSYTITNDNVFYKDGRFREAGLIENMAQTAAAGTGFMSKRKNQPPPVGFIGGIKNLRINSLPGLGDEITTQIKIEHEIFDARVASGIIFLNDSVIAECEFKIFLLKE